MGAYSTLIAAKSTAGSIKSWVNFGLVPSEIILAEAQTEIYRRLRTREMRKTFAFALAQGAMTAPFPTGFLDPVAIFNRDLASSKLKMKTPEELLGLRLYDTAANAYVQGEPYYFSVFDEVLNFDVPANGAKNYTLMYYGQPAVLSGANEDNFLTTRYPALLRFACLRCAAEHIESWDRVERYEAKVKELLREIEVMDDLANVGVDPSLEYRTYG